MYAYFLILNGWAICGSGAQGRWGISNTFNLFDKHGGGRNTSSATRPFALLSPSHFSARKAPPSRQLARKAAWVTPARQRGLPACVCVLICRICVNIDVQYEQLCHYIILTLFISPFFFFFFWPTICKGHRYRVSKDSVWVVCFLIWLPPTPTPLVFF